MVTFEKESNTERVQCEMHWDNRKHPFYIEVGQTVNYRIDDNGNIDAIACDDCAAYFNWDCADPNNKGKWGE